MLNPSGKCKCDCGGDAPTYQRSNAAKGYKKGDYQQYIFGHRWKRTEPDEEPRLCACKCGGLTEVVRGKAKKFIHGHNSEVRQITSADYEVADGGYMTPCWFWKHNLNNGRGLVQVKKRNCFPTEPYMLS